MGSIQQVLVDAKKAIASPSKWCQHHYYLQDGARVQRCTLGAVTSVTSQFAERDGAMEALLRALPAADRKKSHAIATYNDTHPHSEIMALFDRAIAATGGK